LRETLLELQLALGLCGVVLLERFVQIGLSLLAGRRELTSGGFLRLLPRRGGCGRRLLGSRLSARSREASRVPIRSRSASSSCRAVRWISAATASTDASAWVCRGL
jgi:hypothetical protein